jgi:hypothetical protein
VKQYLKYYFTLSARASMTKKIRLTESRSLPEGLARITLLDHVTDQSLAPHATV